MPFTAEQKKAVVEAYRQSETDTGSPEVQVALLTAHITHLTPHFAEHKKDNHSRRGLIKMVADRRTHLKYLERTNKTRYNALMKKMELV